MIAYLHDERIFDAGKTFGRHQGWNRQGWGYPVAHVTVSRNTSVAQAVNRVMLAARTRGSIWLLVLNSHGDAGWMQLGTGLDVSQTCHFAALQPFMSAGARGIEVHSCGSASARNLGGATGCTGSEGYGKGVTFLHGLARAVQAPARGAIHCQAEDPRGRFEGPWVLVQPNGAVQTGVGPV